MEVYVSDNNKCVMCGSITPEGIMVCKRCSEKCDCRGEVKGDESNKGISPASKR